MVLYSWKMGNGDRFKIRLLFYIKKKTRLKNSNFKLMILNYFLYHLMKTLSILWLQSATVMICYPWLFGSLGIGEFKRKFRIFNLINTCNNFFIKNNNYLIEDYIFLFVLRNLINFVWKRYIIRCFIDLSLINENMLTINEKIEKRESK